MCGRASLTTPDWETIRAILDAVPDDEEAAAYRPRYNGAPTQLHPILRLVGGERRLERASWGTCRRSRNRAVIVHGQSKRWRRGRCGRRRSPKAPLRRARRRFLRVAGVSSQVLVSSRRQGLSCRFRAPGCGRAGPPDDAGRPRARFVVLTCAPNALVAEAHDRMPAILPPACVADWLARPAIDTIVPAPDGVLVATPVSTRVNSPANDDARLLAPVRPRTQLSLF